MPEYLKALVVILILATIAFMFAKAPACAIAMDSRDYERRRNTWFLLTLTVFLAHDFWVYIVVSGVLLAVTLPREQNKLAMFLFLLLAVPALPREIAGLGIVDHLVTIDYVRLLVMVVLAPAYLTLRSKRDTEPFGRLLPDKILLAYLVLVFLLQLRVDTLTNSFRHEVFYAVTDIFLPYYVASRSLRDLRAYRDSLMAFALAALVLAPVAVFEFSKHWLLYTSLDDALGTRWYAGAYLLRGQSLRALGTTQQPIVLGYVMAVALGYFLGLRKSVSSPLIWALGLGLLSAGLIAPISRGPWVGAASMVFVFVATGPNATKRLTTLGLLGLALVPLLLFSPLGEKIVALMPFVGSVDANTVVYRERVLRNSIQLILGSPFFGDANFLASPLMQELRQGQGIIDLVNTFMVVGLRSGLIGLTLFCGFFLSVGVYILKGMRTVSDKSDEQHAIGRALLGALLGIVIIIFTASSISLIPIIYWTTAGLGVGYARMVYRERSTERKAVPSFGSAARDSRA